MWVAEDVPDRPIYTPIIFWFAGGDIGVDARGYFVERRDGVIWPIKMTWHPKEDET